MQELTDAEVKMLVEKKQVPAYKLEGTLGDYERGVAIRRQIIADKILTEDAMDSLPFSNYDYTYVSSTYTSDINSLTYMYIKGCCFFLGKKVCLL